MSKKEEQAEKLSKTLDGIDSVSGENGHDQDTITLSTGVILRLKPISKQLIRAVNLQFEKPRVPKEFVESKGREEENPLSPRYKEAIDEYIADIATATMDVCILRGTEIVETPSGIIDKDDEDWAYEMDTLGIPLSNNPRARYLAWIKGVAAPTDLDIQMIMGAVGRLTGVSEADVLEAVQRFRR